MVLVLSSGRFDLSLTLRTRVSRKVSEKMEECGSRNGADPWVCVVRYPVTSCTEGICG